MFRGAGADYGPSGSSALRAHIHKIIHTLEDIQVVFDDHNCVTLVHDFLQDIHKPFDVIEMEAGGGHQERRGYTHDRGGGTGLLQAGTHTYLVEPNRDGRNTGPMAVPMPEYAGVVAMRRSI